MTTAKKFDTRKLVLLGLLTAIVVVLQVLAIFTRPLFPAFSITLVLMPIVVGAALIGPLAGGWLGLVFGFAVLISGDAAPFMAVDPFGTILVVLAKGAIAGLAAGYVYKMIEGKNKTLAAVAAAIVCPLVNSGVFIIGSYVFFIPTLTEWAASGEATYYAATVAESYGFYNLSEWYAMQGFESTGEWLASRGFDSARQWAEASGVAINVTRYIFLVLVGVNLIVELAINLLLSPTIVRLVQYGRSKRAA